MHLKGAQLLLQGPPSIAGPSVPLTGACLNCQSQSPCFNRTGPQGNTKNIGLGLQLTPPHTGSPAPFGPENPGRVRKKSRKSSPGQGPKSPERVRPGVPKESEKSPKPDFWTLFGLFWDSGAHSFGTFGGPVPGYSFGTFFGLFRGSRARRARETLCGAGSIASLGRT